MHITIYAHHLAKCVPYPMVFSATPNIQKTILIDEVDV